MDTFQIFLTIIITIIIAYLFGLVLINIIDNRLSKIHIPKQEVVIKYDDIDIEHFASSGSSKKNANSISDANTNNESIIKSVEKSVDKIENEVTKIENIVDKLNNTEKNNKMDKLVKTYKYDEDYYNNMNNEAIVDGFDNKYKDINNNTLIPPEKNIEDQLGFEKKNKSRVCFQNHQHVKNGKNINCLYGITNHQDPADLSPVDKNMFMLNYPKNMTLQDYVNWLWCFRDKEDQLPYNHLKNLEKLKAGKGLVEEAGILPPPGYSYPPLSNEDYFEKLYGNNNEFDIAAPLNSVTAPMLPYNYGEYSEFLQNTDTWGRSGEIRNRDISKKETAKKLYNDLFSKDSNNINMTKANDKYRIKSVEI